MTKANRWKAYATMKKMGKTLFDRTYYIWRKKTDNGYIYQACTRETEIPTRDYSFTTDLEEYAGKYDFELSYKYGK